MNRHLIISCLPGAIVVLVGAAIAVVASTYPQGTLLRPGPGFFPLVIGVLLSLLGLGVLGEARRSDGATSPEDAPDPFPWCAVLCTCGAVLVFALTVEWIGFVPASCLLIAITAFAEPERSWIRLGLIALLMAMFGTLIFIWGLGLPLNAFGAS